jgi:hypothetical protein
VAVLKYINSLKRGTKTQDIGAGSIAAQPSKTAKAGAASVVVVPAKMGQAPMEFAPRLPARGYHGLMADSSKPVQFSGHASQQLQFRGASEAEVIEAIRTEPWHRAENGRMECRKDYPFNSVWNRRQYATKQVRPVFVEETNEIVVVTVYVYYF